MQEKITEPIEVTITEAGQLSKVLAEAEEALREGAKYRKVGILVTRHDPCRYSLALDHKVPYGETREWSSV